MRSREIEPRDEYRHNIERPEGDNAENPFYIDLLPFEEYGSTVGYNWDATGSGYNCPIWPHGPDVFYRFVPENNICIDVDLCGSPTQYDNWLMVLDEQGDDLVCFDQDYCSYYGPQSPCGQHTARLAHVTLEKGSIYYIVVGHWASSGAEYLVKVWEDEPPEIDCPPDAIEEGEPEIVDGYVDVYNSGCSGLSPEQPRTLLEIPDGGVLKVCGNSGWSGWPDTDWYEIAPDLTGEISVSLQCERQNYLIHLAPSNCDSYAVQQWGMAGYGEIAEITISTTEGEPTWLFVGPRSCQSDYFPNNTSYEYVMTIRTQVVGRERCSWTSIKALYRD